MRPTEVEIGRQYAVRSATGTIRRMAAVGMTDNGKLLMEVCTSKQTRSYAPASVLMPWKQFTATKKAVGAAADRLQEAISEHGLSLTACGCPSGLTVRLTGEVEAAAHLLRTLNPRANLTCDPLPALAVDDIVQGRWYAVRYGPTGSIRTARVLGIIPKSGKVLFDGGLHTWSAPVDHVICLSHIMETRRRRTRRIPAALHSTLKRVGVGVHQVRPRARDASVLVDLTPQGAHTLSELLAGREGSDPLAALAFAS